MKTAKDYVVTEGFGCQKGYPLNQDECPDGYGFHNGIDYGCPSGTPIVVNGVTIGLSGATGYVTGPHLHVGRWTNSGATNPGVGKGFTFKSAKVTEINEDPTNGKYVRVQGDGASWVYLHMNDNKKVKVGQVLKSERDTDMYMGKSAKYYHDKLVRTQKALAKAKRERTTYRSRLVKVLRQISGITKTRGK